MGSSEFDVTSLDQCAHKFIFDLEDNQEVCCLCGIVQIPSVKRFQEQIENSMDIGVDDKHLNLLNSSGTEAEMMRAMAAIEVAQANERQDLCSREFLISKATELDFSCGGFLSTKIDQRNVDCIGKRVNTQHYNKIRYINNYIMSSAGMATYKNAIWMIASFSDKLHLPFHVKERAAEIFRKIYYQTTNIHNSKNSVCACLYYACKEARINRKMEDIAFVAEEDINYNSEIFKTYQKIIKTLKLQIPRNFDVPSEISFLGSKLELDERNTRLAVKMYKEVKEQKKIFFTGRAPRIVATTLLFIAALILNQPIDKKNFCEVTNVTEYILKNRVREHLKSKFFASYKEQIEPKMLLTI